MKSEHVVLGLGANIGASVVWYLQRGVSRAELVEPQRSDLAGGTFQQLMENQGGKPIRNIFCRRALPRVQHHRLCRHVHVSNACCLECSSVNSIDVPKEGEVGGDGGAAKLKGVVDVVGNSC